MKNAEHYQQQETQILNTTLRNITGDIDLFYDVLFCRVTHDAAINSKKLWIFMIHDVILSQKSLSNVSIHGTCNPFCIDMDDVIWFKEHSALRMLKCAVCRVDWPAVLVTTRIGNVCAYSVTLWHFRLTIVALGTQQCIPCDLENCMYQTQLCHTRCDTVDVRVHAYSKTLCSPKTTWRWPVQAETCSYPLNTPHVTQLCSTTYNLPSQ